MQRTLLLLLVSASYLLLAGGRPWTLGPLVIIAAIAALSAPRRTFRLPPEHRILDLSLLGIALVVLLQLTPLPAGLVELMSPNARTLKAALSFPAGPDPAWLPLSIRPQRTLEALGAVIIGILSFWTARSAFSAAGNTRAFCRWLAVIGWMVAVAALIQRATTPKRLLFGVMPLDRATNPFGAFTNRNHFAAWLLLVSTVTIGYLIARMRIHSADNYRFRSAVKNFMASGAVMTALGAFVTLGMMILTLSRSAVIGLGTASLVGWQFGRPRVRFERTTLAARLGLFGVLILLTMVFVDIDGWATRISETLETPQVFGRATIWQETIPIIRDFWLTGTGAGTFSDVMVHYQQTRLFVASMQRWALFNNAHSHYLQVVAEGGLLLAVPVLIALVALWSLSRRTLRADKGEMFWVRVGAAAGLAGLAVQSIWEVSLTMPANAVLAGVLGGLLLYRRDTGRTETSTPELLTPWRAS